jgi:hypothetical protein
MEQSPLHKLTVSQLVNKTLPFMEPEDSLPSYQDPTSSLQRGSGKSSPHSQTVFPYVPF